MNISLVIPAYNEEKYIGDCLTHAIKNSHGAFCEIIVVDNASTDRTAEVARSFPNVKVISELKKGITSARQKGFEESVGDLIAYTDADTRMPAGWVEKVVRAFEKDTDVVCVSGPYIYYDASPLVKCVVWLYWNILARIAKLFTGYIVVGGNFVAKRSALVEIGGFDTTISFYGEDTDIGRRLHSVGKIPFIYSLCMFTSARRLAGEGLIRTGYRYMINFLAISTKGKPATDDYKDIR